MNRHCKSVVSMLMAVLMLIIISIPAMATEVRESEVTGEQVQEKIASDEEANTMYYNGKVSTGNTLIAAQYIGIYNSTIVVKAKRTGIAFVTGRMNLKITNANGGEFRYVSVAADGKEHTFTYETKMSPGSYGLSVDFVDPDNKNYEITIQFKA